MLAPQNPIENLALVREANHRFANHLAVIVSAVNRQLAAVRQSNRTSMPSTEVRAMLEDLATSVHCISNLNRLIAQDPLTDQVDLEELLRLTAQNTVSSLGFTQRLALNCVFAGDMLVPSSTARGIVLMIVEIVTNAIKYARPGGSVRVDLSCRRGDDGALAIRIGDDGCGLPEGFDVEKDGNTGFKVIRLLARSLGELDISSGDAGLAFRLHVRPAGTKMN